MSSDGRIRLPFRRTLSPPTLASRSALGRWLMGESNLHGAREQGRHGPHSWRARWGSSGRIA